MTSSPVAVDAAAFDAAAAAVDGALGAGARYADARLVDRRHESMTTSARLSRWNGEQVGQPAVGAARRATRTRSTTASRSRRSAALTRMTRHPAANSRAMRRSSLTTWTPSKW